ncbi:unnamed protein product [Camellia sinensis]
MNSQTPISKIYMEPEKNSRRGLKLCCIITTLVVFIVVVVFVILFFTILKPKQAKVITQSVTLEHIKWVPLPFHLNVTLGVTVTVENPNHGSFKFQNSTAYATYRGVEAASAPIEADTIPARANHDISTTVLVVADKLVSNPDFGADLASGCINFTTSVTLHGKVTALKFLKTKATVYGSCDVSLYYLAENLTSVCWSSIKY